MNLRVRLLAAQILSLLIVVALLVWGGRALDRLGEQSRRILADNYRSVLAAERMKESAERMDAAALFRIAGHAAGGEAIVGEQRRVFEAELSVEEGNITEVGETEMASGLRAT